MITAIIFDIGNVLVDFCWEEYLDGFPFPANIKRRIAEATVLNDAWNEFDRGFYPEEELVRGFVRNAPDIEKEIRQVFGNIHDMLRRRDYAIPWIQELKAMGMKVYYLSNFSEKAARECADTIDFIPYTDGGILSYEEKIVKPDPKIYRLLLSRYGLIPEQCVFFDDREENCEAARKLGIHGVRFTARENAIEELKKLGVC